MVRAELKIFGADEIIPEGADHIVGVVSSFKDKNKVRAVHVYESLFL